jgi:hypothetical protein
MAVPDRKPVTREKLLVSSLAQTDALAKLLIEKGLITRLYNIILPIKCSSPIAYRRRRRLGYLKAS